MNKEYKLVNCNLMFEGFCFFVYFGVIVCMIFCLVILFVLLVFMERWVVLFESKFIEFFENFKNGVKEFLSVVYVRCEWNVNLIIILLDFIKRFIVLESRLVRCVFV